jgi:two-component system response regulator YesN
MDKVLVVDDERIIREGITRLVPWETLDMVLSGVADNGLTAWGMICADPPRIVITDVKMPGLDGLGLITKTHAAFPQIRFIVLSGYNEFELAKEAMRYGVKHYLLKPCNEQRIIEVLRELQQELRNDELREADIRKNRENLAHVLPLVREQFVRDFVAFRHYGSEEYHYYSRLLGIEDTGFMMVLWEPVGEMEVGPLFGLMDKVDQVFGAVRYQNTTIKNHVLSLLQVGMTAEEVRQFLRHVQRDFCNDYRLELNIAYSDPFVLEQASSVYRELSNCLRYALYLGAGSIITPQDLGNENDAAFEREMLFDFSPLTVAVKSGDQVAVQTELARFFKQLRLQQGSLNVWKTHITELFMVIIRQCRTEALDGYLDKILELAKLNHLDAVQQFVVTVAEEITRINQEMIRNKHHQIIETLLKYLDEHLDNEDLSLKWLAGEVVFMNEGYLSKLFVKETGEKFSHYLMRLRMEKAKELIAAGGENRICEVAQSVGLGNNPQYFSQLFKKYTGCSPSEYKKGQ